LSIAIPEGYASGVEISSSSHAPWSCSRCTADGANRDWNLSDRVLKIGSDPVVVRVSTNNGPVSVSR
jgi:hypothetical protein